MQSKAATDRQVEGVSLRRVPHPYKAMLAISSDLDGTRDRGSYVAMSQWLNTHGETTWLGRGIGLEVGNSIYFDMPDGQFSYWNTDDAGREMIRALIHSGHIDCLHSYGDLATTRGHALRALEELDRHGCKLPVWVDHATAPTNLGGDIMHGHGDEPEHEAYHADLTLAGGVGFVGRGRITSTIAQDVRAHLGGLWRPGHPIASGRTLGKEVIKHALARRGNRKYAMHGANDVLRRVFLRDLQPVWEFMRANPHWAGVSRGETASGLGEVLSHEVLARLIHRKGVCILYTHLSKNADPYAPVPPGAVEGLHRLAKAQAEGDILVTTTSRLLAYVQTRDRIECSARREGNLLEININCLSRGYEGRKPISPEARQGLTFYVPHSYAYRLSFDGESHDNFRINPPDAAGRLSISIPWRRLEFPNL